MATRFYTKRRTRRSLIRSFIEASHAASVGPVSTSTLRTIDADTKEWMTSGLESQYHPVWLGFRGWRVAAETTISGQVTIAGYASSNTASAGRLKAEVYKMTLGGSDVVTKIGEVTHGTDIPTTVAQVTMTFTPTTPITLAPGERLFLRMFVVRSSASFDTATFTLRYDGTATTTTYFEFTETFTTVSDYQYLYMRRTVLNGIGNFFDLLPTFAVQAAATAVTNTVSNGTEIQCTRTAGGIVAEWISPRFVKAFAFDDVQQVDLDQGFTMFESNTAANATFRFKLFHRSSAGVETHCYSADNSTQEFTTSPLAYGAPTNKTLVAPVYFAEDDRVVLRVYVINVTGLVMGGSRTVTLNYDSSSTSSYVRLVDSESFKDEADPGVQPVPSGLSMSGLGNGQ
jgi:hypothetical protein